MPHWFRRAARAALLFLSLAFPCSVAAQSAPATLEGRISRSGVSIADATLTLSGAGTLVIARTDPQGAFTVQLEAGRHMLEVRATASPPALFQGIDVNPGERWRLTLDLAKVGADAGTAAASLRGVLTRIDPAGRNDLTERWLARLPLDRRDPLAAAAELFTDVADEAALGAGTGSVRRIDGIDISDPLDGSAAASHTPTSAELLAITDAGLSAGEPAFSGAIFDLVSRAGSNAFSGLFDARGTGDGLRGDNTTEDLLTANPLLSDRDRLTTETDVSGWIGGPLRHDRAFFSGSVAYTRTEDDPTGPRTTRRTTTPRAQGRVTLAPSLADTIAVAVLFDDPETTGAAPADVARVATAAVANRLERQTLAARVVWQRSLTQSMALRVHWSLLDGSGRTEPESATPGRVDEATNTYTGSLGRIDGSDRLRNVAGGALSLSRRWAGTHAIEAGGEIDTSRIEQTSGLVGDRFSVDFGGRPNLEIDWAGAAQEGRSRRLSGFVRDVWALGDRITIDAGVRVDALRGSTPDRGAVYTATIVQPRVGVALGLDRSGRTVARASYGQYARPLWFSHYDRATPGVAPVVSYEILANGSRREVERVVTPVYEVDASLRHPRSDEAAFGVDAPPHHRGESGRHRCLPSGSRHRRRAVSRRALDSGEPPGAYGPDRDGVSLGESPRERAARSHRQRGRRPL